MAAAVLSFKVATKGYSGAVTVTSPMPLWLATKVFDDAVSDPKVKAVKLVKAA